MHPFFGEIDLRSIICEADIGDGSKKTSVEGIVRDYCLARYGVIIEVTLDKHALSLGYIVKSEAGDSFSICKVFEP